MGAGPDRARPRVEPLASHHDRAAFSCGTPELDVYLHRYARQDRRRDLAQCFVLVPRAESPQIIGCYTLSSHVVELTAVPPEFARSLPSRVPLPATLLGRLAIATPYQGQGYGGLLLLHALRAALRASRQVASAGVVVDALTDDLAPFYAARGFVALLDRPRHLFAPMRRIRAFFPEEAVAVPDVADLLGWASGGDSPRRRRET